MSFVDSITYPESGHSIVKIEHKGKIYQGEAWCHPDDEWSEFIGCGFAELRATLEALKEEYKEEKAKVDELKKFVKAIQQYKNFDNNSGTAKAMYRQLNQRIKHLENIENAKAGIKNIIRKRLAALEQLNKSKEDNAN